LDAEILTPADLSELLNRRYSRTKGVYVQQFLDSPYPTLDDDPDRDPDQVLSRMHGRYLSYVTGRRILLHHEELGYWSVPYVVRGTEQYHHDTKKKLLWIREAWDSQPNPDLAMFITISSRAVGSAWVRHKQMKSLWPKFMDWLRKRFQTDRYVWACEPTKRHHTHFHLVLHGRHPKGLMAQEILQWWQSHGVDIENPGVDVQYAREDPMGYALKYVSKGTSDYFWSALLWLSGGRIWGRSRGLGREGGENNSETSSGWEVLGSVDIIYISELMSGNLEYEDIASIEWHRYHPP